MDSSNLKKYVLDRINSTEIQTHPWKHLIIDNFLPEELYLGIKTETDEYLNKAKKLNIKDRAYHTNVNLSKKRYPDQKTQPYLFEYYNILSDQEVELAIKDRVNLEGYHTNNLSKDMYSTFDIQRSGFVYDSVHPDHEQKIHTLVHYLADEGDDDSLGTTMYSPNIPGEKQNLKTDYVQRAKYKSNSALLFSPCQHKLGYLTNHGMLHLSTKTEYRKSLQTFWLASKMNWLDRRQEI